MPASVRSAGGDIVCDFEVVLVNDVVEGGVLVGVGNQRR
jgi:hypothetical protein